MYAQIVDRNVNVRKKTNERTVFMVGLLKLLKVAWKVVKVVRLVFDILPVTSTAKLWKAQKKVKQTEEMLEIVVTGVQEFKDSPLALPVTVTSVIEKVAKSAGVEQRERLQGFVKRVKAKLGK